MQYDDDSAFDSVKVRFIIGHHRSLVYDVSVSVDLCSKLPKYVNTRVGTICSSIAVISP